MLRAREHYVQEVLTNKPEQPGVSEQGPTEKVLELVLEERLRHKQERGKLVRMLKAKHSVFKGPVAGEIIRELLRLESRETARES